MPRPVDALPCGSRSRINTRSPIAASAVPRLIAVVVLPTPPFWLAMASTRAGLGASIAAAMSAGSAAGASVICVMDPNPSRRNLACFLTYGTRGRRTRARIITMRALGFGGGHGLARKRSFFGIAFDEVDPGPRNPAERTSNQQARKPAPGAEIDPDSCVRRQVEELERIGDVASPESRDRRGRDQVS